MIKSLKLLVLNKVKDIKPGDRVKIDENFGDVIDIDLIFTHIRNLDNEVVSIPNIVLVTKGIKNYNTYPEVVVHFDLFLPHGTDFVKAKQAIIEGARKTKDRISDRDPTIWFKQMDMWTVGCEARVPTRNVLEVGKVKSDLMESVLAELKRRRIPTGRGSEAKVKR